MWYKISQNIGGGAIKSAPLLPTASGENVMQGEEPYVPNHKNFEGLNSELRFKEIFILSNSFWSKYFL